MKSLFRLVLILSLGVNLLAGLALVRRQTAASASATPERAPTIAAASSHLAASAAAPSASDASRPRTVDETDLHAVQATLAAAGFPREVAATILATLITQKHGVYDLEARAQTDPDPSLPLQRRERLQQAEDEMRAFGDEDLRAIVDGERERLYAARYGDLPRATIEEIRRLESEHHAMPDRQFAEILRPVLNPAQIDEYLRHNSSAARQIQLTLSSLDVDEATYSAILDAAIARDGAAAPDAPPAEVAARDRQPGTVETYRQVLGDERFLKIIAAFDATIASADAVYQAAGLPPDLRAELFLDACRARDRHRGADRATRQAAAAATHRALVEKARLTPAQVEGFDRMLGLALRRGDFGSDSDRPLASRRW